MAQHKVPPKGPLFIRYLVIDMAHELQFEVGFTTPKPVQGEGAIRSGALPAGRYVTTVYKGDYSGLVPANASLQAWAKKHRLTLQRKDTSKGVVWGTRAEFYLTDPARVKNPKDWKTQIMYLVAP